MKEIIRPKTVAINVEKGLILDILKDQNDELIIQVRKANPDEKQPEFDEHYGYNIGACTRYIFQ